VTAAEVLRKAAEVIRERGLASGRYESESGAVCMFGAVNFVLTGHANLPSDNLAPERALKDFFGYGSVIGFNDTPGRTADEVIAALLKAAELAESRE
jgi:hypothetical protein